MSDRNSLHATRRFSWPLGYVSRGKIPRYAAYSRRSLAAVLVLVLLTQTLNNLVEKVDYEKLARTLHLKNAHTANTIFYNVKKKIKAYQSQSGEQDVPQSVPATPKKTSRKRVNSHAREPSTSGKGVKRMKTAPKLLIEEEDHGSV